MDKSAPLNALRAFEAAARTGSFTNAARELGVSSAAVSQQVKLLEDFWQEMLFIRQGNRISLTEAGQTAYPQLAHAMSELGALSAKMLRKQQRKKRLTLSSPQSVAETWLAPKIAALADDDAHVPLSIRVDEDPIDLVLNKVDLRIFYGHDLYGEYQVEELFADRLIAVASPGFAARHGNKLGAVEDNSFIHTDWGRGFASSPDWETALLGHRRVDRSSGPLVQSSSAALNFAKHGLGVALVPNMMAADELSAGRITTMEFEPLELTHSYMLAYPKRLRSNPEVRLILETLRNV
ncbi:LysR substrate-binding domain-containing protein [Ruegeria sp. AU67]|uniref:LysR substrate-binding domain-containing protein n=1 Tax=Ruegeria sp. AU67 TaxID=2108530 RepID=UPI000D68C48B|nr:LysR substrate-binding domain-containing protein [Ruegeria sp. AU67]